MLFDKAIMWTDIHFGLKSNSEEHNNDCLAFIQWMIDHAKSNNIKTSIFLGDYFHNRSSIALNTLDSGMKGMQLINDNFEKTYWLVGNHDMKYRHNRSVNSTNLATLFPNIVFIDEVTDIGECSFFPFLVGEEWKNVQTHKGKFAFGHFELPDFKLNSMVLMEDKGEISPSHFNFEKVFSGHFHCRQTQVKQNTKVHYIGNCFPHNFSDVWDDDRGVAILEWNGNLSFEKWPDAPTYRSMDMSSMISDPERYLVKKANVKVTLDTNLTIEELTYIKETITSAYELRELNVVTKGTENTISMEDDEVLEAQTVDQVVESQIKQIESSTLDKNLLLSIYREL